MAECDPVEQAEGGHARDEMQGHYGRTQQQRQGIFLKYFHADFAQNLQSSPVYFFLILGGKKRQLRPHGDLIDRYVGVHRACSGNRVDI